MAFEPIDLALREELDACGRDGLSVAEIACALGLSRAQLEWCARRYEQVADALERARDAALAWWEARARLWAGGPANASLWGKAMAGRFAEEGYHATRPAAGRPAHAPPRRVLTHRDRAKAIALVFAEAAMEEEKEKKMKKA